MKMTPSYAKRLSCRGTRVQGRTDTYLIEPPLALLITVLHCMSPCLAVAFKVSEHDNTQKKKIVGRPGNGDLK